MQGNRPEDLHSSLRGQIAGLRLQLSSAQNEVQQLHEQVVVDSAARQDAELQKQHLWESQLLHQQQSVAKEQLHEQLLQQVQTHDKGHQKVMQKLLDCEEQKQELLAQLQGENESQQKLQQQCLELQGQLQSSHNSCREVSEKLNSHHQRKVQLELQLCTSEQLHRQLSQQLQAHNQQSHLQLQELQAQLDSAKECISQLQSQLKQEVKQHKQQQLLHVKQQQKLQQQLADAVQQQHSECSAAETQAEFAQLRQELASLTSRSQEVASSVSLWKDKFAQAEAQAAEASARVSKGCARVDALLLSEASLRMQLMEAEECHLMLKSQHAQVCSSQLVLPKTRWVCQYWQETVPDL